MRKIDYILLTDIIRENITIARHCADIEQNPLHQSHYNGKIVALEALAMGFAKKCKIVAYAEFLRACGVE